MTKVPDFLKPKPEPVPPGILITEAGHHWLDEIDYDGRSQGFIVLQWQPDAKKWCKSGDIATGRNVDTSGWKYVEPIKGPDLNKYYKLKPN